MKPIFKQKYISEDHFESAWNEIPWENKNAPRDESFLSDDPDASYSYGRARYSDGGTQKKFRPHPMPEFVRAIMKKLNEDFGLRFNACVCNRYADRHQHLGWHADDSPEHEIDHPIAVISFGAERYIYTKKQGEKGIIPEEDKYLLTGGSLFMMPGGYQETHFHKIPKHDQECDGRVSLTFRCLRKN